MGAKLQKHCVDCYLFVYHVHTDGAEGRSLHIVSQSASSEAKESAKTVPLI